MNLSDYLAIKQRNERLLQSIRHASNIAKQYYNQHHIFFYLDGEVSTPSGLFFEITNYLKSYFFSNLPEATCEAVNLNSPLADKHIVAIQNLANEISYNHELFCEIDKALLQALLSGLGVIYFEPIFTDTGELGSFKPCSVDIRDISFDPYLSLEDNAVVTISKIVSVQSLVERYGGDVIKKLNLQPQEVKVKILIIYDLANGKQIIANDPPMVALEEREFNPALAKYLFASLRFATPTGLYMHQKEDVVPYPFPSLFLAIEPELATYARLFVRYVRLLYSVRSLGLIDNSFSEFLNALEIAEEGRLVPVNLQAYFNQLGNIPPIYFLPLDDVSKGLAEIRQSLAELEAKIKERVGIPDVASITKVTAENYIRITPFLIDARYANFVKHLDYFIAKIYDCYARLSILSLSDPALLNKFQIPPETDFNIVTQLLTEIRQIALNSEGFRVVIETDSLSQQRQAKRNLEAQKVVETMISGISQVVNSVSANPQVAVGIANALVELVDLYRLGKKYRETLRTGLMSIVQNAVQSMNEPNPQAIAEQMKAQMQQQELQLKAQELQLLAQKYQMDYDAKLKEIQVQMNKLDLQSQLEQVNLMIKERDNQISQFEAEIKARKQETEEQRSLLQLSLEMQRLELEKLKAQVEAINKTADNIRLEQEAQLKGYLTEIQNQLLNKFVNNLPTINLNVPVPSRKVVRFNEDPLTGEVVADVENKFDEQKE